MSQFGFFELFSIKGTNNTKTGSQDLHLLLPWEVVNSLRIKAQGLGQGWTRPAAFSKWDIGNTSLCVASPEGTNSHSSDASYNGEQGYNCNSVIWITLTCRQTLTCFSYHQKQHDIFSKQSHANFFQYLNPTPCNWFRGHMLRHGILYEMSHCCHQIKQKHIIMNIIKL